VKRQKCEEIKRELKERVLLRESTRGCESEGVPELRRMHEYKNEPTTYEMACWIMA
jgi:hypothetical protein